MALFTVHHAQKEEAERDRIIKEHHLAELEKKQAAEAAAAARKKADEEAVQRWHVEQVEKAAKEKKEKDEAEAKLRSQMRERLLAAGVPEHNIQAMIDGKRPMPPQMQQMQQMPMVPPMHHQAPQHHHQHQGGMQIAESKTTYTRMARKHLSLEALRLRAIEWEFDSVSVQYEPRPSKTSSVFVALHTYLPSTIRSLNMILLPSPNIKTH